MKPVLTPDQASTLDRETQARGIPAELLMERAGRAVARAAVDVMGGAYGRRAVVVCGKGNNGGDGFVAARHLARVGVRVAVVTVEDPDDLREPAAGNAFRLDEVDAIRVVRFTPATLDRELARADVAIDAVFGTGFRGVPEDEWADAIAGLNASPALVVAVDIPSGVNGATGAVDGDAVRADLTVTFGAPKVGVVILPGAELAGAVRVADIGFPPELVRADAFLMEPADVAAVLPERDIDTHKRATGVLIVVAGSRDMTGAAHLVAEAARPDRRGARPGSRSAGDPRCRPGGSSWRRRSSRSRRHPRAPSPSRRSASCSTGSREPTRWRSARACPRRTRPRSSSGGSSGSVRCRS